MANWRVHSKALTAFRRRYRLNVDPTQVLDGILPVAQLDKHWQDDTLNLYGCYCQCVRSNATPRIMGCVLQAGRQEVLVHEVTAWLDPVHALGNSGAAFHLMTCHQNYQPVQFNTSIWYPWLMATTRSDRDLTLAYALGGGGEAGAHQTILTPTGVVTCYGKVVPHHLTYTPAPPWAHTPVVVNPCGGIPVWKFSDPPLRLKPYVALVYQSAVDLEAAFPGLALGLPLNVNFIFSEREDQGDVG